MTALISTIALLTGTSNPATINALDYIVTPIVQGYIEDFEGELNENGSLVGQGLFNGKYNGFIWRPNTPNGTSGSLQVLAKYKNKFVIANGLNNLGDVVGSTDFTGGYSGSGLPTALLWPGGGAPVGIGPGGNVQSEAFGINDAGNICLMVGASSGTRTYLSKVVNGKRKLFDIAAGWPVDINDTGQVLSNYAYTGPSLWTPTTPNGTTGSSTSLQGQVWDLNNLGQVAGDIGVQVGTANPLHASLYLPTAAYSLPAGMNDLGLLVHAQLPSPGAGEWWNSWARGINDFGAVVGSAQAHILGNSTPTDFACWIWDSTNGARTLEAPGWDLLDAWKINDAGQILCEATPDGGQTQWIVLLTPQ